MAPRWTPGVYSELEVLNVWHRGFHFQGGENPAPLASPPPPRPARLEAGTPEFPRPPPALEMISSPLEMMGNRWVTDG